MASALITKEGSWHAATLSGDFSAFFTFYILLAKFFEFRHLESIN